MPSSAAVEARINGTSSPARIGRRAWSIWRLYCLMRTFWPSEPWTAPRGARSAIDAIPAALATSDGRSGTSTSQEPSSAPTSSTRTEPCERARTNATCGEGPRRGAWNELAVREGHCAEERLQVETVADRHLGDEPVREPERDERARCREQRAAPRLEPPEPA